MEEKDFPQTLEGCHKLIKQFLELTDALVAQTSELVFRVVHSPISFLKLGLGLACSKKYLRQTLNPCLFLHLGFLSIL